MSEYKKVVVMPWGCGPRPLLCDWFRIGWTPWSKPTHNLTITTIIAMIQFYFSDILKLIASNH
jgi:hypothetical protein